MKKTIIILAAFAAVASACTREELPTGETNLTFTGTISQTAGTKAQLGEGEQDGTSTFYPAEFAIGDEISVIPNSYWTSGDYSKIAKFVAVTAGATATFEMASGESIDKSDGPYRFYYPYNLSSGVSATQTHVPGNAATGSLILMGDVSQASFTDDILVDFKPNSTLLRIVQPTPNKPVKRIVLSDSENGLEIQLSCDNATAYESYIMGVDPRYDFSSDAAITIYFSDGTAAAKSLAGKSVKEKAGHIITVTNFEPVELPATDLSASATANSYIVSDSGKYKFKTAQGNTETSVGAVASAEVLWESFGTDTAPSVGDLVSGVSYADGYITFTASALKGNAVIAAKDASGTILWSWHIWMTDQPVDQVYNNGAGTMMDRNLGATSATPGDVRALGLMYQWGRKDPFLGGASISYSSIYNQAKASSSITWPSTVASDASNGTIAYAQAHPTTFITRNTSNYDWYYTGSSSTDDTRWTTSGSTKGLYDPCPAGYRVPDGGTTGVWAKAFGTSRDWSNSSNWDSTYKGMNFASTDKTLGSASTIWYPCSGYLYISSGALYYVGRYSHYWSASPYSSNAYSFYFNYNGDVDPANGGNRAVGRSVRCCKE